MTQAPEVTPQAAAYVVGYITLSNVQPIPTANSFSVKFETDIPCKMAMDWWSHNDPSITASTAVLEGTTVTQHTITTGAMPAGDHTGKYFGFSLRLDASDVSGKTLRSQQGFVRLTGARTVAKGNAVPSRFGNYGDGTRPSGGGGIGNWSSYTFMQYNPKNTTYPTP